MKVLLCPCKNPAHGHTGGHTGRCTSERLEVLELKCHHSAFNGYRATPSEYSLVVCNACGYMWRTRSDAVYELPEYQHR